MQKLTRGVDAEDTGKLNFVFLIDDLDRCLPEKAVEMLEAIKLFLDVEGCAFVLALDDEVIERGIAHRYRDYLFQPDRRRSDRDKGNGSDRSGEADAPPITGHEYLEKMVQLPFRLPRWSKREVREYLTGRYPTFLAQWGSTPMAPLLMTGTPPTPDPWLLELIVQAVPPMPRNLVRAMELLDFMRGVVIERKLGDKLQAYPLAQLVLLQLFAPRCFRFLRRGNAEGWKTFERRLQRERQEFAQASPPIAQALDKQPAIFSEQFFDWWEELCRVRLDESADPYVGRTELPLIQELRLARMNRTGFDPRNLFLLGRPGVSVDEVLEPYFSLFADVTATQPKSTTVPPAAPTPPATAPVITPPMPPQHAPGAAPGPAPVMAPSAAPAAAAPAAAKAPAAPARPAAAPATAHAPAVTPTTATASPRDRDEFLRQLLSPSPDAWRNAISREEALIGRTLDARTVDELVSRLKAPGLPVREVAWLEAIAPLLSEADMRRLLRETGMLRQWAAAAGFIPPSSESADRSAAS